MEFKSEKLRLSLLNGKHSVVDEERNLRKRAAELWEPFWQEIYSSVNSSFQPRIDDLLRQDLITVLEFEGQVVGLAFSSFYDVRCQVTHQHSYMQFYSDLFYKNLHQRDVQKVMTLEYLTLRKDFRKSKIGLRLLPIMCRAALEFFRSTDADAVIVTARNDVKVNETLYELGFQAVQKATSQRNFTCDLVAYYPHDLKELVGREFEIYEILWQRRFQSKALSMFTGKKDIGQSPSRATEKVG